MILQALVKYYENLEKQGKLPRQGWCQAKVSYGINLSIDGNIKNIIWLKDQVQAGKKQIWISKTMTVPTMLTRSSGVAANFLCDNSKYLLGIDKNGTGKRITECFEAAKEKHIKLLENTSGEMSRAICAFFHKWNPEEAKENTAVLENWEEITDGGNLIFCMNEKYAQDDDEIERLWDASSNQSETDMDGICLVTGKKTEISRIHRNIKGVPGAQSSGAALVSFNAPSFESYRGMYSVYPVEYKKGKSKSTDADRLQLVAQALCLEEMLSTVVPVGALFYGETRRREVVEITDDLRNEVRDMFEEMHQYYNRGYTPKVKTGKMCSSCSLKELCLPKLNKPASVKSYIVRMLEEGET